MLIIGLENFTISALILVQYVSDRTCEGHFRLTMWTILYDINFISYDWKSQRSIPYHMVHMISFISYGPEVMVHFIWQLLFGPSYGIFWLSTAFVSSEFFSFFYKKVIWTISYGLYDTNHMI